jgi:hypothetical protein
MTDRLGPPSILTQACGAAAGGRSRRRFFGVIAFAGTVTAGSNAALWP